MIRFSAGRSGLVRVPSLRINAPAVHLFVKNLSKPNQSKIENYSLIVKRIHAAEDWK